MKPEELHFKAVGMLQNLCRISHSNKVSLLRVLLARSIPLLMADSLTGILVN